MILRLIDIVLTLFFGFICIATIDMSGKVKLAISPNANQYPVIEGMRSVSIGCDGQIQLGTNQVTVTAEKFEAILDQEIERAQAAGSSVSASGGTSDRPAIIIRIRVDRNCDMAIVRDVVRSCNERGIMCSLAVKRKTRG